MDMPSPTCLIRNEVFDQVISDVQRAEDNVDQAIGDLITLEQQLGVRLGLTDDPSLARQ